MNYLPKEVLSIIFSNLNTKQLIRLLFSGSIDRRIKDVVLSNGLKNFIVNNKKDLEILLQLVEEGLNLSHSSLVFKLKNITDDTFSKLTGGLFYLSFWL